MLWTEAAFSACLGRHWPDHHWQCNWRVAWASSRMCADKRWTLRETTVTIFSHMTRDVSVFVKCDTILQWTNFKKNWQSYRHEFCVLLFRTQYVVRQQVWSEVVGLMPASRVVRCWKLLRSKDVLNWSKFAKVVEIKVAGVYCIQW